MAGKSDNRQSSTGIEYAGKRKWGYDVDQVDDFLESAHEKYDRNDGSLTQQDIQSASFTFAKGGYVIAEVDAALARLEHAVVDKNAAREIASNGQVTWQAQTQQIYKMVSDHAQRAHKERFIRAEKKRPAYDMKQVDRLIDQIVTRTSDDLGIKPMSKSEARNLADLNSSSVANVIFTQRKGHRGYDERQVDYFLDACVQLLSRIESYARVSDYAEMNGAASVSVDQVSMPVTPLQAQDSMTSETMGAAGVSPLIDENATAAFATPTVPAPQPEASYQATQASSSPFDMSSQTGQNFGIDTSSPASFDFNVTAADTATPVIPDLPDNAVVPGETATSQNSSAETTNFGSTTDTNGDSSLAALASMAHTSTTEPSSNQTVSFAPPSPTISALSTPPQAPEPSAASSADASADANTDAATQTLFASNDNHAATAGDNSLGDSDDVDIPSLSFPDFNVSGTDSPKTGE